MSAWRILVIDDEASADLSKNLERSKTYKLLEGEAIAGLSIDVVFAESLIDALEKIKNGKFDLAIIDVVLHNWSDQDGGCFEHLLLDARKKMSVALISSQWDHSSIGLVRKVLNNHPNCDIRLLLRWQDLEEKNTRELIVFQMQNQIYQDQNYEPLQLDGKAPIRILHISDLHFGANKQTLPNLEKDKIPTKIKRHWIDGPDFIAVTGDIANTGHPDDYELAFQWFEWLAREFKWILPTRRILLVPGNHDVSIPIAASRQVRVLKEQSIDFTAKVDKDAALGLATFSLAPFQDFAEKLTGKRQWLQRPFSHWIDVAYRQYGVVFSGFNTCNEIDANAWPIRKIGVSGLKAVENKIIEIINSSQTNNILSIVLTHHSPVSYDVDQPVDNPKDVKGHLIDVDVLEDNLRPPLLMLHGHTHKRNTYISDNRALVVCAPTPSPRPNRETDNARGFTLIELPRNDQGIEGAKIFSYIYDAGNFIKVPDIEYACTDRQWIKKNK